MSHEPRILILDDEPSIRQLLRECLDAEGYQCREAETVEQAIARLSGEEYELVLCDLRMPGMDGFDLVRHVRSSELETGVLMVSAVDDTATAVQLLREGALDYLVKPFQTDEVVERVRSACERVRLTRENRRYALHLRDEVERRSEEMRVLQDELRRSEERRRLLLEGAGEAFLTLDAVDGEVIEANRRCEELLGYSRGSMEGLPLEDLDAGGDLAKMREGLVTDGSESGRGTLRLRSSDGRGIELAATATRIEAPDGDMDFLVLRDPEGLAAGWPPFLANLSHELRTPLTSILGHGEIVEMLGGLSEQQQRSLRNVRSNARHCLRLVEDLLDIALREDGRRPKRSETFHPQSLLEEIATTLAPLADDRSLGIDHRCPPHLPCLEADLPALRQVLLNLGGNALHATRHGGVRLRADWKAGELRLRVSDTGPGISDEERRLIFADGKQGSRPTGVAGLGLTVARRLVEGMGGSLGLWSRPGIGCVFDVCLPAVAAGEGSRTAPRMADSA